MSIDAALGLGLTMEQIADTVARRELARYDPLFFARYMFKERRGDKWMLAKHHRIITDALLRVYTGEVTRLIINMPPRYSKTELAVINFVAWCLGHHPDSEFIHTSYSSSLAVNNSFQIREMIAQPEYQAIFPEVMVSPASKAKNDWRTTEGGVFYATGALGPITGYGAGKQREEFGGMIIIDDPMKADEARSPTMRNNVIEWFRTTLESRKNSTHTPIVLIMQRLHVDDLSGWLLDGGNGEKWEHLCLPALSPEGEALWPEKHDVERLKSMEKFSPQVFAGQYQQRPYVDGGNMFKMDFWKYWEILPQFEYRLVFADTAQKTKEANDYTVFQCWGYDGKGSAWLIDQARGKWEAPDMLVHARAFWNKHKNSETATGTLRSFNIEDKVSGTGLIQTLNRERIPVKGIQRHIDKVIRAQDVIPTIQVGAVYLPKEAPWLSDLLVELTAFPNGRNDDQVDPLMDAIMEIVKGRVVEPLSIRFSC